MEEKSYVWLLSQLKTRESLLKILETGICRGSKLTNWFYTDEAGVVKSKLIDRNSRTKMLLNEFLNRRMPISDQYSPDKVICYLYHRTGVKVVTGKDAIELAENQLHGLQVCSVHLALSNSADYYKVFRLTSWIENGEIQTSLTYGKFSLEKNEEVSDAAVYDKVLSLAEYISELVYKHHSKYIKSMKIDLMSNESGVLFIIKIRELILTDSFVKPESQIRNSIRHSMLKILEVATGGSEDSENVHLALKAFQEKDHKKAKDLFKFNLKKTLPQNSNTFLEMIAKTFDRDRKAQNALETIRNKKIELESPYKISKPRSHFSPSQKLFSSQSPKKTPLNTIHDLLYYVEDTRPRVWVKDSTEETGIILSYPTGKSHEKKLHKDMSAIETGKRIMSPVLQNSLSATSFREQNHQNFLSFLDDEEKRLNLKLRTRAGKTITRKPGVLIGRKPARH